MTEKELLEKYSKLAKENLELPLEIFKKALGSWSTTNGQKKNNKQEIVSDGKYYESFENYPLKPKIFDENDSVHQCTKANHYLYKYYINRINNKNTSLRSKKKQEYNYLELVANFLTAGDVIYALTIIDNVTKLAEKALQRTYEKNDVMKLNSFIDAIRTLKYYIEHDKDLVQNVKSNKDLDKERKLIKRELITKIDGAIALAKEIGDKKFIQLAIDQCYFFAPDLVKGQMDEIANKYQYTEELYARRSAKILIDSENDDQTIDIESEFDEASSNTYGQKLDKIRTNNAKVDPDKSIYYQFYESDTLFAINVIKDYPIKIDNDGNAQVRSLINKKTGYLISAGKENIFQNYRISHVWGRAFDPRYFTNLWNIVIVPSWANDLLDKPNALEGTLESRLQSTIMSICKLLYFKKECVSQQNVIDLNLPTHPQVINEGDVVSSSKEIDKDLAIPDDKRIKPNNYNSDKPYIINVIEGKGSKTLGDIVKYAVYI